MSRKKFDRRPFAARGSSIVTRNFDLDGKIVIITGGCGDIGSATMKELSQSGAHVVVFDLLKPDVGLRRVELLGGAGYYCVDQEVPQQIMDGVAQVSRKFGRLDAVIGNAARGSVTGLLETSVDDWEATLRVNVIGCAILAQAAIRQMLQQVPDADDIRGRVLFTSSWVGKYPFPGSIDYCVSKAALDHLVRLIAQEFADQGIRANAVSPGILDAGLARRAIERNPNLEAPMRASIPLGKLGTPDQIANAFAYLCSRQSSYVTGHILFVDGGCSLVKR
jgi:NAD(P)-dependent dehydrogenase (short-subunit alcohol dehydrogenase family)